MEQINLLKDKGIIVTVFTNKGRDFRKQWAESFAKDISKHEKRQIYFHQFLWHVFSNNVLSCLKRQKAKSAFDNKVKDECYIFYQENDNVLLLQNIEDLQSENIINEINDYINDVYVVDKDFTWTYILTHEEDLGPYFYEL